MKTLLDIIHEKNLNNVTHPEFGTDKEYDHMYCTGFYDKEFLKYKDKKIVITEIGIAKGGSIVLWDEYFDDAQIIGIDNREQGAKDKTKHLTNVELNEFKQKKLKKKQKTKKLKKNNKQQKTTQTKKLKHKI